MFSSGSKSYQTWGVFSILLFATLVFSACDVDISLPRNPVDPDDLRYEGLWHGSSSQTKLLSFQVENLDSVPVVRECQVGYVSGKGFKQRFFTSSSGLSGISNRIFSIDFPDGGSLNGMFISPELCHGKLIVADEFSGELTDHYFTMIINQSPTNIFSAAKIRYDIDGVRYDYTQDDVYYLPTNRNIKTGTGFLINSSIQKQATENLSEIQLVTISAGRVERLENIPQVFSPGIKKYSQNAVDGFEVTILFPGEYFNEYSTSNYTGNQAGSSFEIIDFMEVPTTYEDGRIFKFSARFTCRIYRMEGGELMLNNGFFIGYLNSRHLK